MDNNPAPIAQLNLVSLAGRLLIAVLVSSIWFLCEKPIANIPGLTTLSVNESASSLMPPIRAAMIATWLAAFVGWKPLTTLAAGHLAAFFLAVGLHCQDRIAKMLFEAEDESIRAAIESAEILPNAWKLAALVAGVVITALVFPGGWCRRLRVAC